MKTFQHLSFTLTLSILFSVFLQGLEVSSEFSPPSISLGSRSQYKLILRDGNGNIRGEIPRVNGLEIENSNPSTSNRVTIVNGKQTIEKSYGFAATPRKEGSYTVPSWRIFIDDKEYTVPSATLEVAPQSEEWNNTAFLKVIPEKTKFYVGETLPVLVKLLLRGDISGSIAGNGIQLNGDAFSQSEIPGEFQQGQEIFKNRTYKTAKWPLTLTPLKPGKHEVSYNLEMVIQIPDERGSRRRDPFGGMNSLFGSMFNQTTSKELSLKSEPIIFEVLEIPSEGRTPGFTGAVGQFMSSASVDINKIKTGEPITLTIEMTGEGNFNRIMAPEIMESDDFKAYPPKTSFTQTHETGLHGTKRFEYILIPKNENVKETPMIPLSYFDPIQESFQEITPPAIPIQVTGDKRLFKKPKTQTLDSIFEKEEQKSRGQESNPESQELLSIYPIQQNLGNLQNGIQAPVYKSGFWFLQALAFLSVLAIYASISQYCKKRHPEYALTEKLARKIKTTLQSLEKAKLENRPGDFFSCAEKCIQYSAGHLFMNQEAESLSASFILEKYEQMKISDSSKSIILKLFQTSQNIRFSGGITKVNNLEIWYEDTLKVVKEMKKLK